VARNPPLRPLHGGIVYGLPEPCENFRPLGGVLRETGRRWGVAIRRHGNGVLEVQYHFPLAGVGDRSADWPLGPGSKLTSSRSGRVPITRLRSLERANDVLGLFIVT